MRMCLKKIKTICLTPTKEKNIFLNLKQQFCVGGVWVLLIVMEDNKIFRLTTSSYELNKCC